MSRDLKTDRGDLDWNIYKKKIVNENFMLCIYSVPLPLINCISFLKECSNVFFHKIAIVPFLGIFLNFLNILNVP